MRKISEAAHAWAAQGERTVRLADPLLTAPADHAAMAQALADEFAHVPATDAVVFMGHGSAMGSNQLYSDVQDALHAIGKRNFLVATVEGTPTLDDAMHELESLGSDRVWLAPLMIVAGDHARNDLAGDGEESWTNRLAVCGFETEVVLKGLGEYAAVQKLAVDHARDAKEI